MTLRKWQQEYRDRIAALNEEDSFDEMLNAQVPDGWDGYFTNRARWREKESVKQVHDKYICNAKLAALVTPELLALLERLAEGAQMWSMEEMDNDDIKQGRALAARIREVLALEVSDAKGS